MGSSSSGEYEPGTYYDFFEEISLIIFWVYTILKTKVIQIISILRIKLRKNSDTLRLKSLLIYANCDILALYTSVPKMICGQLQTE